MTQNAEAPAPPTVADDVFRELMTARARTACRLAMYLTAECDGPPPFTRPLLGEILHQATELEEMLDAYGARNNEHWYPFRSTVAAAKLFAGAGYVLLHLQHSASAYRLRDVEGDFAADTEHTIAGTAEILRAVSRRFLAEARRVGLEPPGGNDPERRRYEERLPLGRLSHNRSPRKDTDARQTVTYIATAFLNRAAESDAVHVPQRVAPEHWAECIPKTVSEERLRHLQHQFHNLQSMYDTFVSDTDTERDNVGLRSLRGHVSVVFHLLETATAFVHYYERHIMGDRSYLAGGEELVEPARLLDLLMRYSLMYAGRFLSAGRELAQEMLRRYSVIEQIEVNGPRYRGFHVRPSTLVAKIVRHYGGDVEMELDGETYDAASPMDIFRANERINRRKRNWLVTRICGLPCLQSDDFAADLTKAVRRVILTLAERGEVVIYQRPIPVQAPSERDADRPPMQYILDEVSRLQATGVIDVEAEIKVNFTGDRRCLADIRILAEHGYGEDNFGNNVPLPKPLSYLRR